MTEPTFAIADKAEITKITEPKDTRSNIEKMFFDFDEKTGENIPLRIVPLGPETDQDHKRLNDCIPLLKNYRANDAEYSGEMKGKDVLVLGGRRKGRAGTGLEVMLLVEDVAAFCELSSIVANVAAKG